MCKHAHLYRSASAAGWLTEACVDHAQHAQAATPSTENFVQRPCPASRLIRRPLPSLTDTCGLNSSIDSLLHLIKHFDFTRYIALLCCSVLSRLYSSRRISVTAKSHFDNLTTLDFTASTVGPVSLLLLQFLHSKTLIYGKKGSDRKKCCCKYSVLTAVSHPRLLSHLRLSSALQFVLDPVYTIQTVVKLVEQPAASCKRGIICFNILDF